MHVIPLIYFSYIPRCVIHIFLFVMLQVQPKYVSLCALRCNTAYLIYVCQTAAVMGDANSSTAGRLTESILSPE